MCPVARITHGSMWPNFMTAGWIFVPITALGCVIWGFYALVKWIPGSTKKDEPRTDIYTARAAYYTIGVGLLILTLWTICALAIRTFAMYKYFE